MALSAGDVVEWILKNRRGVAWEGWSHRQIAECVIKAIRENGFAYTVNKDGSLIGVLCAIPHEDTRTLHVINVLTTERGVLKEMLRTFHALYPGWTLRGRRHGHLVRYEETERLCKKIVALM